MLISLFILLVVWPLETHLFDDDSFSGTPATHSYFVEASGLWHSVHTCLVKSQLSIRGPST